MGWPKGPPARFRFTGSVEVFLGDIEDGYPVLRWGMAWPSIIPNRFVCFYLAVSGLLAY